jgi:hypothetical protein
MLHFAGGNDDVTPSGELRLSGGSARTWEFDCRPEAQPSNCNDGVLRLDEVWSEDTLELRFNLVDGTKSDWQAISLTFEEQLATKQPTPTPILVRGAAFGFWILD